MTKKPEVTMIVTVHNAEKYLTECLESVCNQTYKNIEIICVDGGSHDNSPKILENFSLKDDRIHIVNDINTSYGHKVNIGIEHARGRYIGIVESDDLLRPDMIKTLHEIIDNYEPDILDGDSYDFFEYSGRRLGYIRSKYGSPSCYNRLLQKQEGKQIYYSPGAIWSGLYKKSFLVDKRIKLNETPGAAYQDQGFAFLTSILADTSYHINKPVYNYRIDNDSSSAKDNKKIFEIAWEYEYIENELDIRNILDDSIRDELIRKKYTGYLWNMERLSEQGQTLFKKRFIEELIKDKQRGVFEKDILTKDQIRLLKNLEGKRTFKYRKSLVENIYDLLGTLGKKDAVIFGCGKCGLRVYSVLKSNETNIRCFCDNSEVFQGKVINELPVLPVAETAKKFPDAIYVVANRYHSKDMINQLVNLGIPSHQMCVFDDI